MSQTAVANHDEIMSLLRQHGAGSLSYSSLQDGMKWFVRPDVGFVQYENLEYVVHNAVCLGDPICSLNDADQLLAEFIKDFPDPIFIHISKDIAEVLNKQHFFINEMGVETFVDVKEFSLTGSKKEFLRSQRNRAQKDGVTVHELGSTKFTNDDLKRISDEWMHRKANQDHELAFLVRPAVFGDEPDVRKFIAVRNDEVIGFVFFDPMYRGGKVFGYMANILRTLGQFSYSITDYIIVEALNIFREEGVEELSLGFSPFHNLESRPDLNYSKPLHELYKYTYEHANYLYSFKSLAFHKERYRPDLPGARVEKVYSATQHHLPLICLYGVFNKMGIRPVRQSAEHAVHCVEDMIKSIPSEFRSLIKHWKHAHQ